jgi:hypothetical protein
MEAGEMSEHPRYIIKTLADFLTIPQEKLEHALKDLYNWIEYNHAFAVVAKEIPELAALEVDVSKFVWVDDGKHQIIPVFEAKEQSDEVEQ